MPVGQESFVMTLVCPCVCMHMTTFTTSTSFFVNTSKHHICRLAVASWQHCSSRFHKVTGSYRYIYIYIAIYVEYAKDSIRMLVYSMLPYMHDLGQRQLVYYYLNTKFW